MKQLLLALATPLIFLSASVSAEEKPLNKYTEHELRMLISAQAQITGDKVADAIASNYKMDSSNIIEDSKKLNGALNEMVKRKVFVKKTVSLFEVKNSAHWQSNIKKLQQFIAQKSTKWGKFSYSEMMDFGIATSQKTFKLGESFIITPRIPKADLKELEALFSNNSKQLQIERAWQATAIACENAYDKVKKKTLRKGNATSYAPIKESVNLSKFKKLDDAIADLVKLGELKESKFTISPILEKNPINGDEIHRFFYKLEQKYGVYLSNELQGRGVRQQLKSKDSKAYLITIYLTEEDTKTYLKFLKAAGLIK